jgi:oligosaccharide repeat unit polymerase
MVSKKPASYISKNTILLFKFTNPLFLVLFFNGLALILFFLIPDDFVIYFAKESKFYSYKSILFYILFLLSFTLGYLLTPVTLKKIKVNPSSFLYTFNLLEKVIIFFALLTFLLSIIGYIIWFGDILINLNKYISIFLIKGSYALRDILKEKMISGITTMTQFGIVSSMLFFLLFLIKKKKFFLVPIFVIGILALLRSIFFGERLAIIEIVIPLVFIYLRFYPEKFKRFLILGFIFFCIIWASELFRSYMSPTYYDKYTPIEYLIYRFIMYFVTTINNSFLLFDKFSPYVDFLPHGLKFLYKMLHIKIESDQIYRILLENFLNPEYNNKSAWGVLYYDWGYFGFIIAFITGSVMKITFKLYMRMNFWGMLIYPIFMVFLLQSYRVFYIYSSRVVYVWVTVISLFFVYKILIPLSKRNG